MPEPLSGEVRVKIISSALNRRDYWITRGGYPGTKTPCIAGSDGAGIIDKVGKGVNADVIGMEVVLYPAREWGDSEVYYGPNFRVLGMPDQGTFAEYICTPLKDIYPKPKHLSWEQAAAIPLAGLTAWRAVVTQAEVRADHKVLVTGAGGGVSSFVILWCLQLGAEVYISSSSKEKIDNAKKLGVSAGENYNIDGCYKKLFKKSGGFNIVIDSSAGTLFNEVLDTLLPGGRYIFFGSTAGRPPEGLPMGKVFFNHIRIQGTTMGSNTEFVHMLDFLNKNKIKPIIDSVFPLSDIVQAHTQMEMFGHTGKIVLLNNLTD
jgi:NADPH:quinone reductase-like Zn-dependent oxidoreductase